MLRGHALAELGHGLFTNQIDAWDHGPVVAVVWSNFDRIVEHTKADGISDVQISPEEMDIIMNVWEQYKGYTATELVDLTHQEGSPWLDTYRPGAMNQHIPTELTRQYFNRPENHLKDKLADIEKLATADALPAEEYDPDEDSVWEALAHVTNLGIVTK